MRFDLYSLSLFVTVCEQQSIARAAEMHNIAASAVSKRISDLEKMLKEPLFYRRQSGMELTSRRAFTPAPRPDRPTRPDADGARADRPFHGTPRPGSHQDQPFHDRAAPAGRPQRVPGGEPAIRVDFEESTSQEVVRSVSENAADLGIFGGALSPPVFASRIIGPTGSSR